MRSFFALALCFTIAATVVVAQEPVASAVSATRVLTPEQTLQRWQISDVQISPDGLRVAFVVTEPVEGTKRARHIWVYNTDTKEVRRFTNSDQGESSPRWSPDGETLAFVSKRSDNTQIFLLSMLGGEGRALTEGYTDSDSQ